MKAVGWILALVGAGGLVWALVERNDRKYQLAILASYAGYQDAANYKMQIDVTLYVSIAVLVLAAALLIAGYSQRPAGPVAQPAIKTDTPQPASVDAPQPLVVAPPVATQPVGALFCAYCGTPIPDEGRFCPRCGKPVG